MQENTNEVEVQKRNSKGLIPLKTWAVIGVCKTIDEKWKTYKALDVLWMPQPVFSTKTGLLESATKKKEQEKGNRSPITKKLKDADKQINDHTSYIKGYLTEKYKKGNETSHYGRYGFVKVGSTYKFPVDREERLAALEKTVYALAEDSFNDKEFGVAFWAQIATDYRPLLEETKVTDGTVSISVSETNAIKKELRKFIKSVVLLIQAIHPDDWKSQLRDWGLQKEKF